MAIALPSTSACHPGAAGIVVKIVGLRVVVVMVPEIWRSLRCVIVSALDLMLATLSWNFFDLEHIMSHFQDSTAAGF